MPNIVLDAFMYNISFNSKNPVSWVVLVKEKSCRATVVFGYPMFILPFLPEDMNPPHFSWA